MSGSGTPGQRWAGDLVRTGAVVGLLGVAAAGLRARESIHTDSSQGPLARHPALLPVAVAVVAVVTVVGRQAHGSWLPVTALAGLAALAATAVVLVRSRDPGPPADRPHETAEEPDAEPDVLRSVVTAGEQGLAGSVGDPRSGIIECYWAMELAMAGAGTPPGRADTPADVLDRIVALRPAAGRAAARLTTLFREARYSLHPLGESDRADALGALGELRHALGGPR